MSRKLTLSVCAGVLVGVVVGVLVADAVNYHRMSVIEERLSDIEDVFPNTLRQIKRNR